MINFSEIIRRTKIFFRSRVISLIEFVLSKQLLPPKKGSVMFVKIDGIGDYILFRNFLRLVSESDEFRNSDFIFCGNAAVKEAAEILDRSYVKTFVWVDKKRFGRNSCWEYTYSVLLKIYFLRCETVILPNDSKNRQSKFILDRCGCSKVVEMASEPLTVKQSKTFEQEYYESNCNFQFYRNKRSFEVLLGRQIEVHKPTIECSQTEYEAEYIVIFPGAGYYERKWSNKNFSILVKKIYESYDYKFKICGGEEDTNSAKEIISGAKGIPVTDMTGKTSVTDLITIIANARLLISNDTCAIHISAAVNTPAICISNGNHFGRFNPYPTELADSIVTVYPPSVKGRFEELVNRYHVHSGENINTILPDVIFEKMDELITNKNRVVNL